MTHIYGNYFYTGIFSPLHIKCIVKCGDYISITPDIDCVCHSMLSLKSRFVNIETRIAEWTTVILITVVSDYFILRDFNYI